MESGPVRQLCRGGLIAVGSWPWTQGTIVIMSGQLLGFFFRPKKNYIGQLSGWARASDIGPGRTSDH